MATALLYMWAPDSRISPSNMANHVITVIAGFRRHSPKFPNSLIQENTRDLFFFANNNNDLDTGSASPSSSRIS